MLDIRISIRIWRCEPCLALRERNIKATPGPGHLRGLVGIFNQILNLPTATCGHILTSYLAILALHGRRHGRHPDAAL